MWVVFPTLWGAPYFPSSFSTVKLALSSLDLQPGHILIDLGAGDGRIIILSSLLYSSQSVGVEIDPIRQVTANFLISLLSISNKAHIKRENLYDTDLSSADAVTFYLLPDSIRCLQAKLESELKHGCKVISFRFPLIGWYPIYIGAKRKFFVYEIVKD